jgi:hypothetical protein
MDETQDNQQTSNPTVLPIQFDPQTASVLEQKVAIPYTTVAPSTVYPDGSRFIYFDGANYWLYISANGGWRSIKMGVTFPLSLASGGSAKALTAVNGGVVWTDSDSMEISAAGVSGQYLKSNGAAAPSWSTPGDLIGDASDGNVTVNSGTFSSGPITNNVLTRDAFFNTLTINSGYTLDTGGYILFARSLVFVGTGKLTCNGNNGGDGGNGNPGDASNPGYPGGTGGTGGAARTSGTLYGSAAGLDGRRGRQWTLSAQDGLDGVAGVNNLVLTAGKNGQAGQVGGDGHNTGGLSGGAAGTAGTVTATKQFPRDVDLAKHGGCFVGGTWTQWQGAAQNASSGGAGCGGNGVAPAGMGGSGAGSAGNGSNAGIMVVICNSLTLTGDTNFEAIGGNGGNGGIGGNGGGTDGGGGAGGNGGDSGNGGVIIVFYNSVSGSFNTNISAGTAGSPGVGGNGYNSGNQGLAGTAGVAGTTYLIQF